MNPSERLCAADGRGGRRSEARAVRHARRRRRHRLDFIFMNINRISDVHPDFPNAYVTVKQCGNVFEVRYSIRETPDIVIEKISSDEYIDLRTGEVKEFQHTNNRAQSKNTVSQSLRGLRDLINSNLAEPENALWLTLTYKENMTDAKRLYEDWRRFWQRVKYYLSKHNLPTAEYIIAAEPQGRGAWHLHCLFLFPSRAPYIPNSEVARIWGHGFTKTKSLKGIANPGLYLTAYLGDMVLTEALGSGVKKGQIKEVYTTDGQGTKKKAVIKGARLYLYPPGFHIFRCSRGIQRPVVSSMTEAEAQAIIGDAPLTFEKTIEITNNAGERVNIINYRQFNLSEAKDEKEELCQQEK